MKCPSLMLCICQYCKIEYGRKDGLGVFGGATTESHGICKTCLEIKYGEIDNEQ